MDKQLARYRGMIKVEQEYAASGMTDSQFAAAMSTPDVKYSTAQVREWRRVLGIENNVLGVLPQNVVAIKDALRDALAHITGNHTSLAGDSPEKLVARIQELLK